MPIAIACHSRRVISESLQQSVCPIDRDFLCFVLSWTPFWNGNLLSDVIICGGCPHRLRGGIARQFGNGFSCLPQHHSELSKPLFGGCRRVGNSLKSSAELDGLKTHDYFFLTFLTLLWRWPDFLKGLSTLLR